MQQNTIWHRINTFQVQHFAKVNNQDIDLFANRNSKIKKDSNQIIDDTKFLIMQNNDKSYINLDFLYYSK